jgi:hypothetical protein
MFLALDRGKGSLRQLTFLFLVASFANFAAAQGLPKAKGPVARTIILPPKMVAGAAATLAVVNSAGHMASGAVVELSTGQKVTTDATGRALFMAPSEAGAITAKLSGQETKTVSMVVPAPTSPPEDPTDAEVMQQLNQHHYEISYPKFLTLHDRFAIEGAGFNGRADGNRVLLEGQPCLVMASSPVSLVVLPGLHVPIGPIGLKITVGGNDVGPLPVSVVSLEFSGPSETPNAGSQSSLVLRARGTTEPLSVEVRNGSPGVIQFPHGTVQRLTTSGGEENTARVELKFLTAGNYTVTARLLLGGSGSSSGRN